MPTTPAKAFHRKSSTLPADYFNNAIPASTHDWLNDPFSNGDSGAAATVESDGNGKKNGGPNEGTYIVGFGDNGSSGNVNRGIAAIADNTDWLDNIVNRWLTLPTTTSLTSSGSPTASLSLPVDTYVENWATSLDPLFSIVDDLGNEILNGGTRCRVTAITGPGPSDVYSTTTVSCTISPAIPAGKQYRVRYGTKGRLADLPYDALLRSGTGPHEVASSVQNQFALLQGNGYAWNHTWENNLTVYALAWRNLAALYNRSAVRVSLPATYPFTDLSIVDNLAAAGSGSWFNRTGPAMTGVSQQSGFTHISAHFGDSLGAIWRAVNGDMDPTLPSSLQSLSSSASGFVHLGGYRSNFSASESAHGVRPGFAAFMSAAYDANGSPDGQDVTNILFDDAATLTYVSGNAMELTLTDGYFWKDFAGTRKSAVAEGFHFIEVARDDFHFPLLITALNPADPKKASVTFPDGSYYLNPNPDMTFPFAVQVKKWIRTRFFVGDGSTEWQTAYQVSAANTAHRLHGTRILVPPTLRNAEDDVSTELGSVHHALFVGGSKVSRDSNAISWGGFNTNAVTGRGSYAVQGALHTDGSGTFNNVFARNVVPNLRDPGVQTGAGYTWDTSLGSALLYVYSGAPLNLTLTMTNVLEGGVYRFLFGRSRGTPQELLNLAVAISGYSIAYQGEAAGAGSMTMALPPMDGSTGYEFFEVWVLPGNKAIVRRPGGIFNL